MRAEPAHGTRARYQNRDLKCRCPPCVEANAAYHAAGRIAPADRIPKRPQPAKSPPPVTDRVLDELATAVVAPEPRWSPVRRPVGSLRPSG